jgi:predicted membrane metal-binding protein
MVDVDERGWRDAFTLLVAIALILFALDLLLGFQLTFQFLFFAVYFPIFFSGAVYLFMRLRRLRKY